MKAANTQYIPVKAKKANHFVIMGYLVLGAYFLNYPFEFIKIPEAIAPANPWIIFAGGILMLFGALNYFRAKKKPQ